MNLTIDFWQLMGFGGALLVGFATKGRHPAWCALLVVSALVGWR